MLCKNKTIAMKNILLLLVFNTLSVFSFGQADSLPTPRALVAPEKIALARQELKVAFLADDPAAASLWVDSLTHLEDEQFAAMLWDERWLFYYWTEAYGNLFEEVSRFDETQRAIQSWKTQPPADSLFEALDQTLYDRRFELFSQIREAFLNEEEKAFATLQLEYLLRLNSDEEEWAEKLQSFENHYPTSRFVAYLRGIRPPIFKPLRRGWGLAGGLSTSNWGNELARSLNPLFAFNAELYYWSNRWNATFAGTFGGPNLARDLNEASDLWPKGERTSFTELGLHVGYDFVNRPKIRVFPTVGGGVAWLRPPTPGEDEEPLPEEYDSFDYFEGHLSAAITADVKLFSKNPGDWGAPKGSYHGIRLKVGWNGLNFGAQNVQLRGQMFFFAVGYNVFSLNAVKH
jgi:hypothetical protein